MRLHVISVYRNLTSCKPIFSLSFKWIIKLPKFQSLHCLGSCSRNISSCCSDSKVERSILKLIGTSQHPLSSKSFKCQCLFWFYWLVHAISHEIPECMFLSFQIRSFALTSKNLVAFSNAWFLTRISVILFL